MTLMPLQLTPREREVADLMIKGLTRKEISDLIRTSSETVKKHINNIVKKTDSTNQREAAIAVYRDKYIYGSDNINADFFLEHRDTHIEIENDKITSFLKAFSTQICCKDGVSEKNGDVHCDGEIEYVEVNGTIANPLRKERGRLWYKTIFDPPLKFGDRMERSVIAKLRSSFTFPSDYFFIEQPTPCGELKLTVKLGDRFKFQSVDFEAKLGVHKYEPRGQYRNVQDTIVTWNIPTPTILSYFTIRWVLEELY